MTEEISQVAMKIILHAGNARTFIMESFQCMGEEQFTEAREKLKEAKQETLLAHKAQTETIQSEAQGNKHEFSLLFAHAQDTLMTIMSEWNIANQLVKVFEQMSKRINHPQ
ncbi:PTS system, cellobiose-specific IIA component [Seinonella peptonophila]|uniref:PTS system, cellobiose-specific IIA component n=1 Tax=Seinonella peptonophila TaxID=112248 RepID=A0A1M4V4W8_9BACL|nr:PTS lactose/cellobiose transporter subunit IIA [Seinonella peptonophila]SHE63960.1 PTS system, cellobiose-specific IIA component [Seinonella peptonophila]